MMAIPEFSQKLIYNTKENKMNQIDKKETKGIITNEHLENWFIYHEPESAEQTDQYRKVREAGFNLAKVILDNTPSSADQTYSIRLIRMAIMTANSAIACGGK